MKFGSSLFVDVADALGLGNAAIVEKDYHVVQLLQQIASLEFQYHHAEECLQPSKETFG